MYIALKGSEHYLKVLDRHYQESFLQGSFSFSPFPDLCRAIYMYVYNNTKRFLEQNVSNGSLTSNAFTASIVGGLCTSTATNPIWVVKTRLQLDKSTTGLRRYRNSLDCVVQIWRHEGPKGFFRGLSASYLGISETTIQWVMFERLKRVFRSENKAPTTYREKLANALGAGFFAKLFATVITYPHEVAILLFA
jgi:solute carrier family 25, member 33/36